MSTVPAQKLSELAKTIRSKNAGVDLIKFDIIIKQRATGEHVKRVRVLTRETVMKLYGIPAERICDFVEFDSGVATARAIPWRERGPACATIGPCARSTFGTHWKTG